MYQAGRKVICVDDKFPPQFFEWGENIPVVGEVYTIRNIGIAQNGVSGEKNFSVRLKEIVNPSTHGREIMFNAKRFRPVDGRDDWKDELTHITVISTPSRSDDGDGEDDPTIDPNNLPPIPQEEPISPSRPKRKQEAHT